MEVGRFSPTTYGRDIKVSPQDGNTLYSALSVAAASKDGAVYRSTDKGTTGSASIRCRCTARSCRSPCIRPIPSRSIIAARYDGEIYGTEDGGATWHSLPLPPGVKDIYSVACG